MLHQRTEQLYLNKKPLWTLDLNYDGFKWVDCKCDNKCVLGYVRTDGRQTVLVLFNFSDKEATIAPGMDGSTTTLLHTDWDTFGGNTHRAMKKSIEKQLPPYCGVFYEVK